MLALNTKLLRELWKLRAQIASIALVVAAGIMSIVTMRGSYESMVDAQQQFYQSARFADAWVYLVRAPESLRSSLESIVGVDAVDSRVTFLATLDIDDSGVTAHGRFNSLPEVGRPLLNDIVIRKGRYVDPRALDEVIISEKFANARNFEPGDSIRAIINGRSREFEVVGIAISPEHAYAVPPGALYPEDERYGVFWASRDVLGPAFDMDGAFNEAFVSLVQGANVDAVVKEIDDLLEPYGGLGAYPRSDQMSHLILQSELDQNRITGAVIPIIFLSVAVFLLYLVLGRLIATQRGEIAVLKAFGYSNLEVGSHFLMFAVVAVLLGGIVGTIGGAVLGDAYVGMYATYFSMPNLSYETSWTLIIFAFAACAMGAFTGAVAAVRQAVLLPPAEAMRPEAPVDFRPGFLEKMGLGKLMTPTGRMILRNMARKPIQGMFSSLGIALAVAILTIGFFIFDSVDYMMDLQFRQIQREELNLTFREILSEDVRYELANLDGVTRVETYHAVPARLRYGHREDEVAIQGMEFNGELRRIINAAGKQIPVPANGVVISAMLADRLHVASGDKLLVEMLTGKRRVAEVPVSGIIEDFLGLSVYMSKEALWKLTDESGIVSGALLAVDENALETVQQLLKQMPSITGVASPTMMLQSFEDVLAEGILIAAGFLLGFACIIAVGVVYNAARIALSERGRELASLRVMGFRRREVAWLLLGEQGILTIFAIPIGWIIGYVLSYSITIAMQTDIYRIPFIVESRTYITSALLVLITAIASSWLVRRRLDRLDLIKVLKTRE